MRPKTPYSPKARWDKQVPTYTANEEEGICSNWRRRGKAKIRSMQWFQQIAQIVACCVDKGRLLDPNEDKKLWHVKHLLWSTAMHMWQLNSIVATIFFNDFITKRKKEWWELHLKIFRTFIDFTFLFDSGVSWCGNISLSWAVLLTVLHQTSLNLSSLFGGTWKLVS